MLGAWPSALCPLLPGSWLLAPAPCPLPGSSLVLAEALSQCSINTCSTEEPEELSVSQSLEYLELLPYVYLEVGETSVDEADRLLSWGTRQSSRTARLPVVPTLMWRQEDQDLRPARAS